MLTELSYPRGSDPTIVSNYGGPSNQTYNYLGTPEVRVWYPCVVVVNVHICGGTAAGWVEETPEGIIVNISEAAGIAIVASDQWIGVSYTAKAPNGSASAITIQASVYTQDENGGVNVFGASCAPVSVYENYPQNVDYPKSNQTQDLNIASCSDSLSIQIPTIPSTEVASLGEQLLSQTVNLVNQFNSFIGALNTISGTYNTTNLNWSGLVFGGQTIVAAVDPYIVAANAGAGTVVNAARSFASFQITDVYGGGGGCDHCHPESQTNMAEIFGLSLSKPEIQPGSALPQEKVTISGANLGSAPGTVKVSFCNQLYVVCSNSTTVTVNLESWSQNQIVFYLPSTYKCGHGLISVKLANGQTPAGSPLAINLYSTVC